MWGGKGFKKLNTVPLLARGGGRARQTGHQGDAPARAAVRRARGSRLKRASRPETLAVHVPAGQPPRALCARARPTPPKKLSGFHPALALTLLYRCVYYFASETAPRGGSVFKKIRN